MGGAGDRVITGHGGTIALEALVGFGVTELFTLSGGHVFPLYDAAVRVVDPPVRLVDVRHESTATFAAEAVAKLTGRPGVAVLTAGPGVTNGISAVATAQANGTPLVVLGGRAPQGRWGAGSLQEFDHVPVLAPVTKRAVTATAVGELGRLVHDLAALALTPHRGPVFADLPLDVVFAEGEAVVPAPEPASWRAAPADPDEVRRAVELLARAVRPAVIAGSDVWLDGAHDALRAAVEALRIPTFLNGNGRGCLPADHELVCTRSRGLLRTEADVVCVIGTPLDFRLSFGSFGSAQVIHVVDHPHRRAGHVHPAASPAGDLRTTLTAFADHAGDRTDHDPWIARLRAAEAAARAAEEPLLAAASGPVKPTRIYGELRRRLDRDAVVVCDGGDFVSYAGKYVDVNEPGCWLDAGPYGCLGTGLGYAMAARIVHPDRQVVALLGDGAASFSLMDVDTLVRHDLPVVLIVGNNGIWGLEKHPMRALYGYDVAADLQPGLRYDDIVRALGGAGETVTDPDQVGPALDRALSSGVPYLVNVLTDPTDAYPRTSNLA
jgi:acetolactate synthase-1/2/3 large subunit